MSATETVMPTSEQIESFRTSVRTALLNRNVTVQDNYPSRGTALDAIEKAWADPDRLHDLDAAMAVLDPDYKHMSERDQVWLRDAVYNALIDMP